MIVDEVAAEHGTVIAEEEAAVWYRKIVKHMAESVAFVCLVNIQAGNLEGEAALSVDTAVLGHRRTLPYLAKSLDPQAVV